MGFLGIGAMEALVILVIALIIFGPGRLPEIMGDAGRMLRDFRRATRDLTSDFEDTVGEVRGTYRDLESEMRSTAGSLRRDAQGVADDLNTAVADAQKFDAGESKPQRRARNRPKLDQVSDPSGESGEDVSSHFPSQEQTPAENRQRSAKSPVGASLNGSNGSGDDLLSMGDVDDLLAVDNDE